MYLTSNSTHLAHWPRGGTPTLPICVPFMRTMVIILSPPFNLHIFNGDQKQMHQSPNGQGDVPLHEARVSLQQGYRRWLHPPKGGSNETDGRRVARPNLDIDTYLVLLLYESLEAHTIQQFHKRQMVLSTESVYVTTPIEEVCWRGWWYEEETIFIWWHHELRVHWSTIGRSTRHWVLTRCNTTCQTSKIHQPIYSMDIRPQHPLLQNNHQRYSNYCRIQSFGGEIVLNRIQGTVAYLRPLK